MGTECFDIKESVYFEAMKRNMDSRLAFIDRACPEDPSLAAEIKSLIEVQKDFPGLPDQPAWSGYIQMESQKREITRDSAALPFERLGEFKLIRPLSEGGMGVVYLALQESVKRQVALKVIRPERTGSSEAQNRFTREVDAISKLRHPNIVTLFGIGEERGVRYYVMELLPGKGLDQVLRQASHFGNSMTPSLQLHWMLEIAGALHCAHEAGILHRDVKPSNIHITPGGQAMLLDFGISRHMNLTTLTCTGDFRGTPHYSAPEQIIAKQLTMDARMDIYSLGITFYEAFTGRVPFQGESTDQVFHRILTEEPAPLRQLNRSIPRDLETIIMKCLEKDRSKRYASMADLIRDLELFKEGKPIIAQPAGAWQKSLKWIRRHKIVSISAAAAGLTLMAVAMLIFVVLLQNQKERFIGEKRFKPISEALNWPEQSGIQSADWCMAADRENPNGYLLLAIHYLDKENYAEATRVLQKCVSKCDKETESELIKDALFLLNLVKYRQAQQTGERRLGAEAEAFFIDAGSFDPANKEALIWREADLGVLSSSPSKPLMQSIRINSEHFLVHLSMGATRFHLLFRGGKRTEFAKAISAFEKALEICPNDVTALTFLGRTYYFLARFYNLLELTEKAKIYLEKALECSGGQPYHMIYNTLGAIALLEGDHEAALAYNEKALHVFNVYQQHSRHTQNILRNFGDVLVRRGKLKEAVEEYKIAFETQPDDNHIQSALAELYWRLEDPETAISYIERHIEPVYRMKDNSFLQAETPLLCARIFLSQGDYALAEKYLIELYRYTIFSPRDFAMAAILLTTFPDAYIEAQKNRGNNLRNFARVIGVFTGAKADFKNMQSPIGLTAKGVGYYMWGKHVEAIGFFRQAMESRDKWPERVRDYYWCDHARDLYYLAMSHFKLAELSPESEVDLFTEAQNCFAEAEELFNSREVPLEGADLIERVREKAWEILHQKDSLEVACACNR